MESLLFPTLYLNAQRIKSKLFSVALTGVALFMSALLAACTSTPTQLIQKDEVLNDPVLKCQRFYYHFNAIVDTSKVRDAQTAHIDSGDLYLNLDYLSGTTFGLQAEAIW